MSDDKEEEPFNLVNFLLTPTTAIMGVGVALLLWFFLKKGK
jgi:hypothetical protein